MVPHPRNSLHLDRDGAPAVRAHGLLRLRHVQVQVQDRHDHGRTGGAEGGRTREIVEGQADRSENNLQSHYFNCFRSVYSGFGSARFRGWATPYGKAAGQNFMRTYVHDLARGVVGLRELFDMFEELHKDLHGVQRPHMEELFCEVLDEAEQTTDAAAAAAADGALGPEPDAPHGAAGACGPLRQDLGRARGNHDGELGLHVLQRRAAREPGGDAL